MTLVATDLDRTLIYSRAALALGDGAALPRTANPMPALAAPVVCVETYDGAPSAFLTRTAANLLVELKRHALVVPVTTRTCEQLSRVRLPGPPARFAVAANGGVLLVDGTPDAAWTGRVQQRLSNSAPLDQLWPHLRQWCSPEWTKMLRRAEDLFCYAVIERASMPVGFLSDVTEWAQLHGWQTSLQGRKLYWVPRELTKSAAVAEIVARTGATQVLAAGDSLLDRDLLECADRAIMPAHGELFESEWSAAHVARTSTSGVLAGEEILRWFLQHQPAR